MFTSNHVPGATLTFRNVRYVTEKQLQLYDPDTKKAAGHADGFLSISWLAA